MKKTIIVSSILKPNIINELESMQIMCIPGGKSQNINNETAFHPDMLYYKLLSGSLLVEKGFTLVNKLDTILPIIEAGNTLMNGYPYDCAFNCFVAGKNLICGKSASIDIINDAIMHGYNVISVNQGYAACSTVRLRDDAYITSDITIYKAIADLGFDVLQVSNLGIQLNGYNCGFIGGCALYVDNEIVAFSGNIKNHSDYNNIKSFCNNHKIVPYSLSSSVLYNYGGYIRIA